MFCFGFVDRLLDKCLTHLSKYEPIINPHFAIMNKIESLMKNSAIVANAIESIDFSVFNESDANTIRNWLTLAQDLCKTYARFESGFEPDKV